MLYRHCDPPAGGMAIPSFEIASARLMCLRRFTPRNDKVRKSRS